MDVLALSKKIVEVLLIKPLVLTQFTLSISILSMNFICWNSRIELPNFFAKNYSKISLWTCLVSQSGCKCKTLFYSHKTFLKFFWSFFLPTPLWTSLTQSPTPLADANVIQTIPPNQTFLEFYLIFLQRNSEPF